MSKKNSLPKAPSFAKGVLVLYIVVMIFVVAISFLRRSTSLGMDMAKIQQIHSEAQQ